MSAHSSYNKETSICDSYLPNCGNYTKEAIRDTKGYLKDETLNLKHLDISVEDFGDKYSAEKYMHSFANEWEELNKDVFEYFENGKEGYIKHCMQNYYNLYEFIVWLQKQGFHNARLVKVHHEPSETYPNGWISTYIKGDRE